MKSSIRPYLRILASILWSPSRIMFLLSGMAFFGIVGVFIANYRLLLTVLAEATLRPAEKFAFLATLFSNPVDTYGINNLVFFLVLDFLFILNLLAIYRLFRERLFLSGRCAAPAMTGLFIAILGLGCFSCGSVLLFFFLSVFGITFSSVLLGAKLWVLGLSVLLFLVSIGISLKKLATPPVC